MIHTIPRGNWHLALAACIASAAHGDTIICHTAAMQALAERARQRMCPEKMLFFAREDA